MKTLDEDILELIAAADPGPVFLSDVMQAFPEVRPVEVYKRIHAMKNERLIAERFVRGRIQMALTVAGIERLRMLRELKGAQAGVPPPHQAKRLAGTPVPSPQTAQNRSGPETPVPPPQPGQKRPRPGAPAPVPHKAVPEHVSPTPKSQDRAYRGPRGSYGATQANSTGELKTAPEPIGHFAQLGRQSARREGFGCSAGNHPSAPKPGAPGAPGIQFADRARGVPAKPPLGQAPPDGNGAHSAPSQPFAECAPEFASAAFPPAAGEEAPAAATLASAQAAGASEDQHLHTRPGKTGLVEGPRHHGTTVLDIDEIVNRVLAANRVIERISEPCPQGDDCAGDGKHTRIFDCEQGCGFRGCVACLMAHEAEPHWSDSDTAREMYADRVIG